MLETDHVSVEILKKLTPRPSARDLFPDISPKAQVALICLQTILEPLTLRVMCSTAIGISPQQLVCTYSDSIIKNLPIYNLLTD